MLFHSMDCLFIFDGVLCNTKYLNLNVNQIIYYFSFLAHNLGVISKNHFSNPRLCRFINILLSNNFIVLVLTFSCLMHFEIVFSVWCDVTEQVILLHVIVHLTQYHLLKRLLPPRNHIGSLSKSADQRSMVLFLDLNFIPLIDLLASLCHYHFVLITIAL